MHSEVKRFVDEFYEQQRHETRKVNFSEAEIHFLEYVFGPEFAFNFKGLRAQFPFKDYKGGDRFIDYYYQNGPIKLIIEVDSLKFHVTDISPTKYDDHQERQNDLILAGGWTLIRLTPSMIMKNPMTCRRQLVHGVGHCYIKANILSPLNVRDLWHVRKLEILRSADPETDYIKARYISERFNIDRKTAIRWLSKMVEEGSLEPVISNSRTMGYKRK